MLSENTKLDVLEENKKTFKKHGMFCKYETTYEPLGFWF